MVSRNVTFKIDGVREDEETGFISGSVLATGIGVFNYRDSATGQIIRELRSPEEVFKKSSMDSLKNITWTNNHPPKKINKRNVKSYSTGFLHGDIGIHNNEFLKSDFTIQDEANIEDYNGGKIGVSCGYDCKLIKESGIFKGQRYDAKQTEIKYNHISSVNKPRITGSSIITDSDESAFKFDAIEINKEEGLEPSEKKNKENKQPMIKMKIDNHDVEVSESAKIAIENKLTVDSANQKQIQTKLDEALQTNETLKGQNEALTLEIKELKKVDVQDLMKKRRILEKEVTPFLSKDQIEKIDSLEDFDLIKSAISSKYDSVDLTGKSEEAILGMFEVVKLSQPVVKSDASDIYNNATKNTKNDNFNWDEDPLEDKEEGK